MRTSESKRLQRSRVVERIHPETMIERRSAGMNGESPPAIKSHKPPSFIHETVNVCVTILSSLLLRRIGYITVVRHAIITLPEKRERDRASTCSGKRKPTARRMISTRLKHVAPLAPQVDCSRRTIVRCAALCPSLERDCVMISVFLPIAPSRRSPFSERVLNMSF